MYSKLYWCKADVLYIVLKSLSGVVSKKFPHLGASLPSDTWIQRMVLINIMSHDVPCLLFLLVDCWRHMLCRSWIRGKFECFTKFGKHFGFPQYTLWLWRGRVVNFSGKLSLSIFSNIQGVFLNFYSRFSEPKWRASCIQLKLPFHVSNVEETVIFPSKCAL